MPPSEEEKKALAKAIKLLSYRPRSRSELAERLRSARFEPETVETVLDQLTRIGHLDDVRFSEALVLDRINISSHGRSRIERELLSKGIDRETAAGVLDRIYSNDDDLERALFLAVKQLSLYKSIDLDSKKRRLIDYLKRRGFPAEIVFKVCRELLDKD